MKSGAGKKTLIIGCGNPHRRDDGVGRYVIAKIESMRIKGERVKTLSVHQLDIGLADEIKNYDQVIFVDATVEQHKIGWEFKKLAPEERQLNFSHLLTPSALMRLVEAIYQKRPIGWVFSISGQSFDFGPTLSAKVQQAADKVVGEISSLVGLD